MIVSLTNIICIQYSLLMTTEKQSFVKKGNISCLVIINYISDTISESCGKKGS